MPLGDQSNFPVRFEWGLHGLQAVSADATVVVVDVFSFTTSVTVACARGVTVFPCEWNDDHAATLAVRENAVIAARRGRESESPHRFSLSPESLLAAGPELRLVLPSQNGSVVAYEAARRGLPVVAASFRNAKAVAAWLSAREGAVAVIAAGERWEDGTWRFALEDLICAGAIISHLQKPCSPEAMSATAAFAAARNELLTVLQCCSSGREMLQRGLDRDVALAAEMDSEECVPILVNGAFR